MILSIHQSAAPLIALIAGIVILFVPRILNYVIALYLILIGLLGLFGGICRNEHQARRLFGFNNVPVQRAAPHRHDQIRLSSGVWRSASVMP